MQKKGKKEIEIVVQAENDLQEKTTQDEMLLDDEKDI